MRLRLDRPVQPCLPPALRHDTDRIPGRSAHGAAPPGDLIWLCDESARLCDESARPGAPCRPRWGPPHPIGGPVQEPALPQLGTDHPLPSTSCAMPSRPARSGCWSRYCCDDAWPAGASSTVRPSRPGAARVRLALSTVVIFAANGLLVWLLAASRTIEIDTDIATRGWAWWWASLVLIVVAHDAWSTGPTALHHRRWFRAVHGRHHQSLHPTPLGGLRLPSDRGVGAGGVPAAVPAGRAGAWRRDRGVPRPHDPARNTIGHCAYELWPWRWTPRGWLGWITPVSHHHFHHARKPRQLRPVL